MRLLFGILFGALLTSMATGPLWGAETPSRTPDSVREARYYQALSKSIVQCALCPNRCVLAPGQRGLCTVRENRGGKLFTLVYGTPCAVNVDPIEKKPFFHVLPGSSSFSISTAGCNMRCAFCQNWQISQARPEEVSASWLPPDAVVDNALAEGCATIAFTYTEPTVFYEYMLDTARAAAAKGVSCVLHSCGYINEEPLTELAPFLTAANIDLKGFSEEFYRKMGQGHLQPVLDTLVTLKRLGVWLEITNLIIPGANDDPGQIEKMCAWIKEHLGDEVPLHFSAFRPAYKLERLPQTSRQTLEKAREIASAVGLKYVYIGNYPGNPGESTYCPRCKKNVLHRIGYRIESTDIVDGKCRFCGYVIRGIWSLKK